MGEKYSSVEKMGLIYIKKSPIDKKKEVENKDYYEEALSYLKRNTEEIKIFIPYILLGGVITQFVGVLLYGTPNFFSWSNIINDTFNSFMYYSYFFIGGFIGLLLQYKGSKFKVFVKFLFTLLIIFLIFGLILYLDIQDRVLVQRGYIFALLIIGLVSSFSIHLFKLFKSIDVRKVAFQIFMFLILIFIAISALLGQFYDAKVEYKGEVHEYNYMNDKYIFLKGGDIIPNDSNVKFIGNGKEIKDQ